MDAVEKPMSRSLALVVDDDPASRAVLKTLMEASGFQVKEAENGSQALDLYRQLFPAVVLLDVMMPGMDGFEVCAMIQATPGSEDTAVLMITGLDDFASVDRAFEVGAIDFITKPIRPAVLLRRIRHLILARQAEELLRQSHAELEARVQERTAELARANAALQAEILERQHLAEKLTEERNLLRTLIDNLPDYVFIKDRQGRYVVSNAPYAHFVDAVTWRELIGKTAADFFPQELAAQYVADDEAVIRSGRALVNTERISVDSAGNRRWMTATKVPLVDSQGQVVGLVGISRDMTERKQMEEELREYRDYLEEVVEARTAELTAANEALQQEVAQRTHTEERLERSLSLLQATFEATAEGILAVDRAGKIVSYNPIFARMWSIPDSVLVSGEDSRALEFAVGQLKDPQAFLDKVYELYSQPEAQSDDLLYMTDGRIIARHSHPHRLKGEIVGRVWNFRDITAFVQAQETVRRNEENLRRITDNMLDMLWETDPQGTIEYASPSCQNVLGYQAAALCGQVIYAWLHPDDVERVKAAAQTVGRVEGRFRHADGHYVWLEVLSSPLADQDGTLRCIVFASRDITERKQVERELQELNRLKTEFLSTAAHELRTPLTSIRGFSELLLTRQADDNRRRRFLTLINEQAAELGVLIDDLLDISRLEANRRMSLKLEPVRIADVFSASLAPFADSAPAHRFRVEGLDSCPPVIGDYFRLTQIGKNLLSNAVKYSPRGGAVLIRGRVDGDCLEISVQDEGIGMTPEEQAHLFEKFYRADASNTAVAGTGLGLAICKQIVELHGGKIWVESQAGTGTTVWFTLPLPAREGKVQALGTQKAAW